MPAYLRPDVYVEFVPGTPPIAGVGTSTAAFIGVADIAANEMPLLPGSDTNRYTLAPVNEPQLITNWGQFETTFGTIQANNNLLAHAVYGFFLNGGTACYVVRVATFDTPGITTALATLEAIDEVALVVAPGAEDASAQAVIDHCELLGDRFAILDGKDTTTVSVAAIKGTLGTSNYAGLYFPYIQVFDSVTGSIIDLPPSGHLAGVYARVDAQRGVHKAPANEGIRGAVGLAYRVTDGEQNILNPEGINAIRSFREGIRVWGARTLGGDANGEFKYIPVQRLMMFIAESIEEGTRFAVFEPNAQPLWERINRAASDFLTRVWRDGALFGTTPGQAFFVKCDESTNPPAVREAGIVVTEIGVAPVKPAEFVVFRISQAAEFDG